MSINNNISEAIKNEIKRNFNVAVAEELNQFIENAQKDASFVKLLTAQNENLTKAGKELSDKLEAHATIDSKLALLEKTKNEIAVMKEKLFESELNLLRKESKLDATVANAKADIAIKAMELVTRNTLVRESSIGSTPLVVPGTNSDPSRGIYGCAPYITSSQVTNDNVVTSE